MSPYTIAKETPVPKLELVYMLFFHMFDNIISTQKILVANVTDEIFFFYRRGMQYALKCILCLFLLEPTYRNNNTHVSNASK